MADSIHSPDWWQPYLPQLRREFSELTMDILIAGGDAGAGSIRAGSVSVDWDVFNEDALTWLDMYLGGAAVPGLTEEGAYAWAWSLNESTRRSVVREIDRWVRSGDPLDELEQRLGLHFDDRRARRIAATEVTRIYASGNVMAWKASGVVDGKQWRTAVDENVCFPKWTMVETEYGPVSIQNIRPGMRVWTRLGLREVVTTKARAYNGLMTRLRAAGRRIIASADHPVWESEKGWLPIGEFQVGNRIETFGKQVRQVDRVTNFAFGDAQDKPAMPLQKGILSRVPVAVAMPVSAVAKDVSCPRALRPAKRLAALSTIVLKRHVAPLLTELTVLYHKLFSKSITVYDIQVADVPEFYANGILVHNCPICSRLNNKLVELERGWEFSPAMLEASPALKRAIRAPMTIVVPPAHVACRCWLAPVVFEAMTPAEIEAMRWPV